MTTLPTPHPTSPAPTAVRPVVATSAAGRRRRPSGEPPPLPRHVDASIKLYAIAAAVILTGSAAMSLRPVLRAVTEVDLMVLEALAVLRADPVAHVLELVDGLGDPAVTRTVSWGTILALVVFRRFQHLLVYLAVLVTVAVVGTALATSVPRMRPTGVELLTSWTGTAHPSRPVAALSLAFVGMVMTLVPGGRWRRRALAAAATLVLLLCFSRLYLGVDHPSDVLASLALGWALPLVAYRLVAPEQAFPVTYRGVREAHVPLDGARGEAIVQAVGHQLGLTVLSIEPFGLEGSAGSMPLRLQVSGSDGAPASVFGKLYTVEHLRADRRYKLARMVLYGRLEDEKPFSTVRRLVEYEDHMLRLLRDAGLPSPAPLGFVEITPEREYLILMEFFAGAREVGDVELTDDEIDSGLRIVRRMWEAGVAHRDIKPSNLLVRDGRLLLIDVAFATVRPTPWRQAVDLANMMLTLALSSSVPRVQARAELLFAADDIAEAVAASRSITIPSQLKARMRARHVDLVAEFRRLAPDRPPVPIQLWSLRRVGVTLAFLAAVTLGVAGLYFYARVAGLL